MREILAINPTPNEIRKMLVTGEYDICRRVRLRDYTVVILGKSGPTGKTWLCTALKEHGFNAVEISEDIMYLVDYGLDDRNHCFVNHEQKLVTVILNEHFHV